MSTTSCSNEWKRAETPSQYHGYLEQDYQNWPRRWSRQLLRTDERPNTLFKLVRRLPSHPRIIDIGCGTGRMLETVGRVRPDAELYGVDLAPVDTLEFGLSRQLAAQGRFYQADLLGQHAVPQGHFDLVYSSSVIEHVFDGVGFFRAMAELAKPGGYVLVHTANQRGLLFGFYNDPTHVRPYPIEALRRAAHMVGMEVVEARNERSWTILALAPWYRVYCLLAGRATVLPFFWEHLLAVQSVIVARKPGSCGGVAGSSASQPAPTTRRD